MATEIREILNLVPNDPEQVRITIDIIETYCKLSCDSRIRAGYHGPSMRAVYEMLSMGESPLAIQELCRASGGESVDANKALKFFMRQRLTQGVKMV